MSDVNIDTAPPSKRNVLAGISLATAGACLAISPILGALGSDSAAAQADGMATGAVGSLAKIFAFQAAAILILPGLAVLAGRSHGRGAFAVVSGACVLGAGMFGLYGFVLLSGLEDAAAGYGRLDPVVNHAFQRMEGSAVAAPMFVLALLFAHLVGIPWFSWALVRARHIRWWVAVIATAGTVMAFFGSGTTIEAPGWMLIGIALIAIAATLPRAPHSTDPRLPLPTTAATRLTGAK